MFGDECRITMAVNSKWKFRLFIVLLLIACLRAEVLLVCQSSGFIKSGLHNQIVFPANCSALLP